MLAGGEASKALNALKALDAAERMEVPSAVVTKAHQCWGEQPSLEGGVFLFVRHDFWRPQFFSATINYVFFGGGWRTAVSFWRNPPQNLDLVVPMNESP